MSIKKKLLLFVSVLVLSLVPTVMLTANAAEFDGDGSSDNPYKIETAEQLADLASAVNNGASYEGAYFLLTGDVDLGGVETPWTSIGKVISNDDIKAFSGTFDGGGHKITGLYLENAKSDYQGLFGYTDGTIKNLAVYGNVNGGNYVGGIVGYNCSGGKIENSSFSGNVKGGGYVGGIAGLSVGNIENSYSIGNITGSCYVGGIAGLNSGNIENSYNTGAVTGVSSVGGIAGHRGGIIMNCYNVGAVTGNSSVGSIIGNSYGIITNCYYLNSMTQDSNALAISEEQFTQQNTYVSWDFDSIWDMSYLRGRPILKSNPESDAGLQLAEVLSLESVDIEFVSTDVSESDINGPSLEMDFIQEL